MSFQRLATIYHSNATAYPPSNQPISTRQAADESSSEDSDSDDGSEHLLDYNARILRRRNAQARARNRLQPAYNRINDGLQPLRHLANRATGFFDEAGFQLHVVVLTIGRLLLGLLWFILEALWRTVWSILFLIGEIVWRVLDPVLRIVFAIPQILRRIPRHNFEQIPLAMALGLIGFSLWNGFVRMKYHVCDDTRLTEEWTGLSGSCNQTKTIEILKIQNAELDKLVFANYDVLHSISDMASTANLNPHPGYGLMRETTALVQFAKAHNESLKTFSTRYDFVSVVNAVHSNVTAFNIAVEKFVHNHNIQLDELEIKAQRILANAKGYKLHSPGLRFFLESNFALLPVVFSRTGAALQSSNYVRVATHFLQSRQRIAILQQSNKFSLHLYNAREGLIIAQEALTRYEPYWRMHCQQYGEAGRFKRTDCGVVDPSDLKERLAKALEETIVSERRLNKVNGLHNKVNNGLDVLRTNLAHLLKTAVWYRSAAEVKATEADKKIAAFKKVTGGKKIAAGKKAIAGNKLFTGNKTAPAEKPAKLKPASARAILHQFVVEVGLVDLWIGTGTFELGMAFDDGVARGSRRYKRLEDGRVVSHLEQYRNEAQNDGSWFWGPWW